MLGNRSAGNAVKGNILFSINKPVWMVAFALLAVSFCYLPSTFTEVVSHRSKRCVCLSPNSGGSKRLKHLKQRKSENQSHCSTD